MGKNSKIDWCDASWNPVTGCLHGCPYCYARRIAERFGSRMQPIFRDFPILREPVRCTDTYEYMREMGISDGKIQPYPFDFTPTFHVYRLDEPAKWKKPRNIFVCSMADLFGNWVPDAWILAVIKACREAPQHRYLFLTKNPERYEPLYARGIIGKEDRNLWFGTTIPRFGDGEIYSSEKVNTFISCEPMLAPWPDGKPNLMQKQYFPPWVILGAETGKRKGKVVPERSWVEHAVETCRAFGAKVFMKESLRELMGADFVQEFPW